MSSYRKTPRKTSRKSLPPFCFFHSCSLPYVLFINLSIIMIYLSLVVVGGGGWWLVVGGGGWWVVMVVGGRKTLHCDMRCARLSLSECFMKGLG